MQQRDEHVFLFTKYIIPNGQAICQEFFEKNFEAVTFDKQKKRGKGNSPRF